MRYLYQPIEVSCSLKCAKGRGLLVLGVQHPYQPVEVSIASFWHAGLMKNAST